MNNIFKNDNILKEYNKIWDDTSFSLKKYEIDFENFNNKLDNNNKINWDTAYKILDLFNDYYEANDWIEDIFNTIMIENFYISLFKNSYIYWKVLDIFNDDNYHIDDYDYIYNKITNNNHKMINWENKNYIHSEITSNTNTYTLLDWKDADYILDIFNNYYNQNYSIYDIFNEKRILYNQINFIS